MDSSFSQTADKQLPGMFTLHKITPHVSFLNNKLKSIGIELLSVRSQIRKAMFDEPNPHVRLKFLFIESPLSVSPEKIHGRA
jgi:hypothetical protein